MSNGATTEQSEQGRRPISWVLIVASMIVILAGLKAASPLLVPFLLAMFLSMLAIPGVMWLRRRRVPTWAAVTIVVVGLMVLVAVVVLLVGSSVADLRRAVPRYEARFKVLAAQITVWLDGHGLAVSQKSVLSAVDPGAVMKLVGGTLMGLASALSNTVLVLLVVVFILAEAAEFPQKLRAAIGDPDANLSHFQQMADDVKRYLVYKTLLSLATGVTVGFWVWILGVDFPLLWGLLAFLLNYIPNIGSILAAVPPVLVALLQFGVGRSLAVAAGFVAVNLVLGNVVEPVVMGRRLGLSNLVVFVSLVFWGWLWGPVGMLLSVPLTMVAKLGMEHSERYRWVAILLDSKVPVPGSGKGGLSGAKAK